MTTEQKIIKNKVGLLELARQLGNMYLSSADETNPDTRLSSCIAGAYAPEAPRWHSAPSNAILPGELASLV